MDRAFWSDPFSVPKRDLAYVSYPETRFVWTSVSVITKAKVGPIVSTLKDVSIGRASNNTIKVRKSVVSRHHAVIKYDSAVDGMTLVSFSPNGTMVNGNIVPAHQQVPVALGDIITIASFDFVLKDPAEMKQLQARTAPAPIQPVSVGENVPQLQKSLRTSPPLPPRPQPLPPMEENNSNLVDPIQAPHQAAQTKEEKKLNQSQSKTAESSTVVSGPPSSKILPPPSISPAKSLSSSVRTTLEPPSPSTSVPKPSTPFRFSGVQPSESAISKPSPRIVHRLLEPDNIMPLPAPTILGVSASGSITASEQRSQIAEKDLPRSVLKNLEAVKKSGETFDLLSHASSMSVRVMNKQRRETERIREAIGDSAPSIDKPSPHSVEDMSVSSEGVTFTLGTANYLAAGAVYADRIEHCRRLQDRYIRIRDEYYNPMRQCYENICSHLHGVEEAFTVLREQVSEIAFDIRDSIDALGDEVTFTPDIARLLSSHSAGSTGPVQPQATGVPSSNKPGRSMIRDMAGQMGVDLNVPVLSEE